MKTLLVAGTVLLLGATTAVASSPDASSITVPKAGPKTLSTAWAGTVSAVSLSTTFSDCSGNLAGADKHVIHVSVAPGAYGVVKAKLALTVDSAPLVTGDFIELKDPSGQSMGVDQQHPEMYVEVSNPVPGDWTALVCSAFPDSAPSHDYKATVTITTKCKAVSPCPTPPKKRR
jgi:hypothetical protein